jgi:hypothetical protein
VTRWTQHHTRSVASAQLQVVSERRGHQHTMALSFFQKNGKSSGAHRRPSFRPMVSKAVLQEEGLLGEQSHQVLVC